MAKLEQDTANKLNEMGGNILCVNAPKKFYFGIDYIAFETGDKFKGVKMIPAGAHFIHTSLDGSSRSGLFFWIDLKETIVYEWEKEMEMLIEYSDKEQAQRLALGVVNHDFDSNLGVYPINSYEKWKRLSCFITKNLLKRLSPIVPKRNKSMDIDNETAVNGEPSVEPSVEPSADPNDNNEHKINEREKVKQQLLDSNCKDIDALNENFSQKYDSAQKFYQQFRVYYSKIPSVKDYVLKKVKQRNGKIDINVETTKLNMDKSEILQYIVENNGNNSNDCDWDDICGEIQYCFISFFIGQCVKALEQWKLLTDLICHCDEIITTQPKFYFHFLQTLYFQLNQLPSDWFKDEITKSNFLNQSLMSLFEILSESQLTQEISQQAQSIKLLLKTKFGKEFDNDDDQDGPVIVDLQQSNQF